MRRLTARRSGWTVLASEKERLIFLCADAHYNQRATDQIMADLARFLKDRISSTCGH